MINKFLGFLYDRSQTFRTLHYKYDHKVKQPYIRTINLLKSMGARQHVARMLYNLLYNIDKRNGHISDSCGTGRPFHSLAGDDFWGHSGKFTYSHYKESGGYRTGTMPLFNSHQIVCGHHDEEGWYIYIERLTDEL